MVGKTLSRHNISSGLRRFDVARDIPGFVRLVRAAFVDEFLPGDEETLRSIELLRFQAPLLWLASRLNPAVQDLFTGFVWLEDNRIVGNVTLTRVSHDNRHWQISNVAVEPAYRRRGIARELMSAAVDLARERGARWLSLQVRHGNTAAVTLYKRLGFDTVEGTMELTRPRVEGVPLVPLEGSTVRRWQSGDVRRIHDLVLATMPDVVRQIAPLRPGPFVMPFAVRWLDQIAGLLRGELIERWLVEDQGRVVASLVTRAAIRVGPHRIELTVHPEQRGRPEEALVSLALNRLSRVPGRAVTAEARPDHVAAVAAFQRYGFREVKTLDRMLLELGGPPLYIPVRRVQGWGSASPADQVVREDGDEPEEHDANDGAERRDLSLRQANGEPE